MKVLLFANTAWYLYNFRLGLAEAARDSGYEVLLVSPPGPYGEKLLAQGFRWIPAPLSRRSLNPLREFVFINWLRRLVVRENVRLVHGFTIKCAVYGAIAARLSPSCAHVSAVAGMGFVFSSTSLRARLLRPLVRGVLRVAIDGKHSRLILQNRDDVSYFRNSGVSNPAHIRLIRGSGVDCRRFERGATRAAQVPLCVLLAARLLWDKGIREYVQAARFLRSQGRNIRFLLAGAPDEGNPDAVPVHVLNDWVEEGLIEWLGHVDDMPQLLSSVHVVTLPSAYGEGLPKSLIEAAACGLAIVTTDAPGCREVVTHEVDGLLVPQRDAEALAAAIARLDDDSLLLTRLGAAARRKAILEFDESIVVRQTLSVYHELLGEGQLLRLS